MLAKRCRTTRHFIRAVLIAGISLSALPAYGDSQQVMDKMLETYINVTPGATFDTQRRGGITFGSIAARSRIVSPQLVAVQPPSFRGSCSGFDLIGGSFSFLNGEQLQQFLRSIASNALNYAFTLALEGVCPTCMQKMEKLRDWSEAINSKLMDSCHWGEELVNRATTLDEWARAEPAEGSLRATVRGTFDDYYSTVDNYVSRYLLDQQSGESSAQNVVMEAMQRSNMAGWFGTYGDRELLEVAMSVTGTVIKRPPNAGESCANANGDQEYCLEALPDTLDVEQLVNGTDSGPITIYRCNDYPSCLSVTPQTLNSWPGIKSRIRAIMFGSGGTTGIVGKYLSPVGADWTLPEQALIEGAPAPIASLLEGVAKHGGSVVTMANQLTDLIAVQIARDLMLEVVTNVERTFGKSAIQMSAVMLKRLSEKMNKFSAKTSYEDRQFDNTAKLIPLMLEVKKAMAGAEQAQSSGHTQSATKQ